MITRFSIVTLVIFIISIFFVIVPVRIPLPRIKRLPSHIPLNLSTAPIIAIAILWASQCLGPAQIRTGIAGTEGIKPYNILILFFSLAYMAITLDITGILESAAHWVRNKGGSNGRKVFCYFYVMVTVISAIVGNDPVILTGTAFLTYYIHELKLNPMAWLISEFSAANTASMVLFVGNPTNVVICEGFGINNVAFSAYTIFPFFACIVFGFIALFFQFRDDEYIKRALSTEDQKDPARFLLDPIGAWVGGALLGSCLATVLVVSFFNVDVWKITLPFAVAKFVFDLVWDDWRYRNGKMRQRDEAVMESEFELEHESRSSTVAAFDEQKSRKTTQNTLVQSPTDDKKETPANQTPLSQSMTDESIKKEAPTTKPTTVSTSPPPMEEPTTFMQRRRAAYANFDTHFKARFYTLHTALPRLPFALVPFAFSQFILVEALDHQGWIDVFAVWLNRASGRSIYPIIWLMGVLGVILCNLSGTNIGATILLTKVARAADLPNDTLRAAAIALAVASNIGAVSFTFSASLAGLLWKGILDQRGIPMKQTNFAFWNLMPIIAMTAVGLAVVCIEMAVLY